MVPAVVLAGCGARSTTGIGLGQAGTTADPIAASPTPPGRSTAACRLPVTWGAAGSPPGQASDEGPLGAGFISFPDGAFHADPNAHGTTPFGSVGLWYDRP